MIDVDTIEEIDILKNMISEVINLSIVNEDSVIHRNKSGLDNPHMISLVHIIIQKLYVIQNQVDYLIRRFEE